MAKDLNMVQLTGRLGRDVETKYTPSGANVTTFSVASGRSYKTADGESREETEWFSVVAWNKLGEICAQYLQKGSRVYIEGRLQTRSWEDEQGEKRYKTEVIANDMIMLDTRKPWDDSDPGPGAPPTRTTAQPAQPAAPVQPAAPTRQGLAPGIRPNAKVQVANGRPAPPRRNNQEFFEDDGDLPL